ncbi:MAG: glycosyltransferase [Clostridia bacterium]|nr:glycosyltransferase [Clostridia bacterium]
MEHKTKPKVLMYYAFEDMVGGPLVYLRSIMNSELKDKFEFVACFQNAAPGGWDGKLYKRMVEQIRREKPDIVHVHGLQSEGMYGVMAARKAGCKHIVTTVHGFAFDAQRPHSIKYMLYRYFVEPWTLRKSKAVYCVCKYASDRPIMKKHAGKNSVGYIHNAVPDMIATRDRATVRGEYGIADDEVVFVIAGRVAQAKGFDLLAEAVKLLEQTHERFRLMVVGDGDYTEAFSAQVSAQIEAGRVILVGKTDRVADYLAACDVFVLPSFHENLPIALLEAGKMGLPCVASAVGGVPEAVLDGQTGFLITERDAARYAACMARFIDDPALLRTMGAAMKADVDERFSMKTMCQKIEELYVDGLAL